MYNISEVARLLHIKEERVRKWCEEGRFEGAVRIRGEWQIPADFFNFLTDTGNVYNDYAETSRSSKDISQYFSH